MARTSGKARPDPRARRTREALVSALVLLAHGRRYREIRIDDILSASGVGRSTFYEHFAGKDALLVAAMDDALALLARAALGEPVARPLALLQAHLRQRGTAARELFRGSALRALRASLLARVETALAASGARLRLPPRLLACMLGDAVLSPLLAWLAGRGACDARDLADATVRATMQMRRALTAASGDAHASSP